MRRSTLISALLAAAALVLAAGPGAGSADPSAGATARAWAIKVIVPGQPDTGTAVLTAPQDAVSLGGAYAYPSDGSIVSAASVTASVTASSGTQASAGATSQVTSLTLFGGDVVAQSVTGETHALANASSASGDTGVTGITGLTILGQQVTPTPNQQVQLGDWGYAILLEQKAQGIDAPLPGYHDFVTAIDVFLTAAHGGLPAQSEIQVGYAEADAQASEAAPLPVAPTTATPPEPRPHHAAPPGSKPLKVTPKLGQSGYVFPVYGLSSFADTYGAGRSDVSGGWHHGDDLFAPLGTPVLAVAHGVVFSVGWNEVGGWRLWLRDDSGNEFYYAHLSAYSPLAVDGAIVDAGDVLGFIGDTGDARGTPYHLHFEIHPVGLLELGYDGAVDPTGYLRGWRHVQNVRFEAAAGWAPAVAASAPKAGAVLLQSVDISSGSGLDPASLERAVAPQASEGAAVTEARRASTKPVIPSP